jgi:peptidoglycan/LPS O-acetylase OafA/YrhL
MDRGARRAKIAALVLLALGVAFYLLFTVGELAGGDVSGIQHLPPVLGLAGLAWLSWRRPTIAGIALLALAVPLGMAYVAILVARDLPLTWALEIALPPIVTGLLLVRAGRPERAARRARLRRSDGHPA